ncbi:acyltransferase family protein [Aquicoccus porphyridii]|uniref:acyltransferase family protein n=1 Tax=Aquicoccus porphyridii TaxID=1852029 RepID=UPI00273E6252|nr:acyltransferase family protein [Aquicoccus porphyridii]
MTRAYRSDIDGLRAIAILGVVIDHAGLGLLPGGFAGVDVFFVISGYLIGGHIFEDLANGQFTFGGFYKRRLRRIYPALVTVLLVTMIAGWFVMMPHDYRYMGGAAFTALLSLSNIWFFQTIDYFHPEALSDPLIHTWSLGVEEQFYLLVPLLLVLLWRRSPAMILTCLVALVGLSLGLALATSAEYRMQAFYLLHTRAWELFAGVLVAYLALRGHRLPGAARAPLAALGLALIVGGMTLTPLAAPWPGPWTLPAVLGTVLILAAGREDLAISRLLSLAPMRFVGLISYSLYLWHQPVFSLLKQAGRWPDTLAGLVVVLAGLTALSALSWRVIEQPFRRGARLALPRKAALGGMAAALCVIVIGGHMTRGYPARLPGHVQAVLAWSDSIAPSYRRCIFTRDEIATTDLDDGCTFGADPEPGVLLWGDSHAARLAEPLGNALGQHGHGLRQMTLSSCLPVAGLINTGQTRATQCPAFNARVLDWLDRAPGISHVVLFATWNSYIFDWSGPDMFGHSMPDGFYAIPTDTPEPATPEARHAAFARALAQTLTRAAGADRQITIVLALPRPDTPVPRHFARQLWNGTPLPDTQGFPRALADRPGDQARALFARALAESGLPAGRVRIVDPAESFCTDETCGLVRDGALLYSDGNHPSLPGIDLMLPPIVASILTR